MPLTIKINADDIAKQFKELALEVEQDIGKAVANLASITHAKIIELATQDLKSSRQTYVDALGFEEISPGVWVVSLDEKASYIEEGVEAGKDMKPALLKNATKVSKDGFKYRSIPFDHGKSNGNMTPAAQNLVAQIKTGLKAKGISFKGIEKDANGSPKIGKLHTVDLSSPNDKPPGKGNTSALKGVNVYQSMGKGGKVKRDILTMRTVSDSPASAGKWISPGSKGKEFFEKAQAWAEAEFENTILPAILDKWK